MAISDSITNRFTVSDDTVYEDVDVDGGGVLVKDGATTIYSIEVDNSDNSVEVFLQLWDLASGSAPSVGDAADEWYRIPASTVRKILVDTYDGNGLPILNGCYMACVTTGGQGGTTSPTNAVKVTIRASL